MSRSIVQNGVNFEDFMSTLELVEKPIPKAVANHVVVHIKLRPINPIDVATIRFGGAYFQFAKDPLVPGSEGYGIVHSVGDGVTKFKSGDRVVPLTWDGLLNGGGGSWQEYVCVQENLVLAVPNSISDEIAAQFLVNPWTAYGLVKDLAVPKDEYILQTAAGSVLGRLVIQLAKHWGIKTINVVRRHEQVEELKLLGANEVICSTTEDIVTRVKEITNNKLVYGSLDAVGGTLTKSVAASTRDGGQVFVYGLIGGDQVVVGTVDLLRSIHVTGWLLNTFWEDRRKEFVEEVWKLLGSKVLEPYIGEKFDLANFKEAIRKSEEVGRGGKVLLTS